MSETPLNTLVDKLNARALAGWQIRESRKKSHQSFLARNDRECLRRVDTVTYGVTVHVMRRGEKGPVLGLSEFVIGPQAMGNLDHLLDEAVYAANLVANEPFDLPARPGGVPDVDLADPDAGESCLGACEHRLRAAVEKEKSVRLSSAEFFIDRVETRLLNHRGLDLEQAETKLHAEIILLAEQAGAAKEFITRYTRRFLRDFDLEGEVALSARYAREATRASLPRTGRFPVLLSEEPLDNLFSPLLARASARLAYNRMIQNRPGDQLIEPGNGDPVSVWSNGIEPGMAGSGRFDSYGTPLGRHRLVADNRLEAYLADVRYGTYLGAPVTGELGNLEISSGSADFEDLLKRGSADAPLYHLTAFSAFEPNPITGAFSAEIRAGYEITPGGVRPIKGGSVSGVLHKDLSRARLSKERAKRERVWTPKGVLFDSLAIAGD